MNRTTLALLTLCTVATATTLSTHAADGDKVIATVDGKAITASQLKKFSDDSGLSAAAPKNKILDEMISRRLVLIDAAKQGFEKRADFQAKLVQQKEKLLLNEALKSAVESNPITDAEVQKIYDTQIGARAGSEFNARHILVKEEKEAKALIARLDKGEDFATLAKEHSTGPSGKNGGDLGWFSSEQMVPAFSEAASKMKKGNHSKSPVKTQFGWHVIKLEDTRPLKPPPFEELKPKISQSLISQRINGYIMKLRSEIKVEIKE